VLAGSDIKELFAKYIYIYIYIYIYQVHACEYVCLEIIQQIYYSGGSGCLRHDAVPVGKQLLTLQSGLLHPSAGVKQSTDPED